MDNLEEVGRKGQGTRLPQHLWRRPLRIDGIKHGGNPPVGAGGRDLRGEEEEGAGEGEVEVRLEGEGGREGGRGVVPGVGKEEKQRGREG